MCKIAHCKKLHSKHFLSCTLWKILHWTQNFYTTSGGDGCDKYEVGVCFLCVWTIKSSGWRLLGKTLSQYGNAKCLSCDWLWQNINYQLRLEAECHPTCLYHFWFRLRDLSVHCMCRHVAYLLWPLLSWWPSIDTARRREGEFEMYHKIRLILIKLSSCICFCGGICNRMFFTGNSLSCDFYSCRCKTSLPRSDIGSEALRSIAVTPYVPICQAAPTRWYSLPSHSWSNCLLHLGLWPRHKCWCQHWLPLFSTQNAFTWSPLLWVTECECFWKGAGHPGCGAIVMVSGPPIFSTNSPKGINVATFSCGGAVMSSSEHWQCTGWKRSCLCAA